MTLSNNKIEVGENSNLVNGEENRRVSLKTALKYRLHALIISWISVFVLLILGIITFVFSVIDDSSAAFAFGFDALLDTLSSLVVIWRYWCSELYSPKRESVACLVLGHLFLASTGIITWKSITTIMEDVPPVLDIKLFYIYLTDAVVCSLLLIAKLYLGWKLESKVLYTDSINTGLEALMAMASIVGEVLSDKSNYSGAWLIDPVAALFSAAVLLIYGVGVIIHSGLVLKRESYAPVKKSPALVSEAETSN